MSEPNPLRSAILSFFSTLLVADDSSTDATILAQKDHFEAVAAEHYEQFASRSDAAYARIISLLDIITPGDLLKVCEGFRQVSLTDPYNALNATRPVFREGIRALRYGCAHGLEPCAISYRHSPHACGRTVSRAAANLLRTRLQDMPALCDEIDGTCVAWIDRAVKGLSSDGAWFLRGLLPYGVATVAVIHRGPPDLQRPWIWLEWRLSTRAMSAEGWLGVVGWREVLLIALQAMYEPGDMLSKYEYKDEMEAVILDIFAFGLAAMTQVRRDRMTVVSGWSDYKVGLVVALAVHVSSGDTKWSSIIVDDRNPYRNNLFVGGLTDILALAGAKMQLRLHDDFRAYALVGGNVAFMKRRGNDFSIATRMDSKLLARLKKMAGKGRIAQHLNCDLRSVSLYCDVNPDLPQHRFDAADELAVLASCHVSLCEHWESRTKTEHDICNGTVAEGYVVAVSMDFDLRKAAQSARRKRSYSMKRWWDKTRVRGASAALPLNGKTDAASAACQDDVVARKGVVVADYNQGCVRLTTRIGKETVFRRLSGPAGCCMERGSALFACVRGHISCAAAAALNGFKGKPPSEKVPENVVLVQCVVSSPS